MYRTFAFKDLVYAAIAVFLIVTGLGLIAAQAPMDADSGPAPLTAAIEGGRV